VLVVTMMAMGSIGASAQTPPTPVEPQAATMPEGRRLRVYLDCGQCFGDYLRDEIDWVDFVRQPQDADVVLLSSTRGTGGGGTEYLLRFVGAGRFQGTNREHRSLSMTGDPENVRRDGVLGAVTVGFLSYMALDGLPPGFELSARQREAREGDALPERDPWNLWVFSVRGNVSFDAEETTREFEWSGNVSADRVTDRLKLAFGAQIEESTERFDLDEDEPLQVSRQPGG
jgi:hypothetical protein